MISTSGEKNMGTAILFFILYMVIPPGIFILGKFVKNQIKYTLFGRKQSRTAIRKEAEKEGFNRKASKRIRFTLKDPRNKPAPFRLLFVLTYFIGAGVALFGGLKDNWVFLLVAVFIAYFAMALSYLSANAIVSERDQVLKRMLELKGSRMRLVNKDKDAIVTPESEFRVLKWGEDLVNPVKMHLYMPTNFDILEVDSFLESFNLIFGGNGQWISDDTDKEYGGFDFNAGVAAIRVSPKLPQLAMWHERYLNPEYIHWSYFPLALGSENGVPIYNEEDDTTERVLGFAVNSGQEKLAKQKGFKIGREITAAPQILIAGGTGGGKALDSKTVVEVIVQ